MHGSMSRIQEMLKQRGGPQNSEETLASLAAIQME